MCTRTPAARSRSSTWRSRMSLPDTSWPIPARAIATALIPGPPTPTTWMRRGSARSGITGGRRCSITSVTLGVAISHSVDQFGEPPRPTDRTHLAGTTRDVIESGAVVPQCIDHGAKRPEFGLGQRDRSPAIGQPADVLPLVVLGRSVPGNQHRRDADRGDLVNGARTST